MSLPQKPRRRWFRYSLRTFFTLLTVCGLWLGLQVNWIRQRHALLAANRQRESPEVSAPWNLRLLGERARLIVYLDIDDQGKRELESGNVGEELASRLIEVRRLFPEAAIDFTLR